MAEHDFVAGFISIHALREEGDYNALVRRLDDLEISIHALREEGDYRLPAIPHRQLISIHALREEGDLGSPWVSVGFSEFLSTPSARRATDTFLIFCRQMQISIHALREEGDNMAMSMSCWPTDFYPRPPRGGRLSSGVPGAKQFLFLSTPSARRATSTLPAKYMVSFNFYPRPPRGGRPEKDWFSLEVDPEISIHALREEGDWCAVGYSAGTVKISIHALREEGDLWLRPVAR